MKKLLIVVAALLLVGSAFAQSGGHLFVQPNASNLGAPAPSTTNNDDSCDIGNAPAATLLLPYFEVDYSNPDQASAVNTVFTITNTSSIPQIAHVTIWTDWSYPVLDFNVFLTGYDVQGISLYDVLHPDANGQGHVPATSIDEGANPHGAFSNVNTDNPNFTTAADDCVNLPGTIPASLLAAVDSALTGGPYQISNTPGADCGSAVGGTHTNAIGYVTVDVAATCSTTLPNDPDYFSTEILFDNTLIGDYERINPTASSGNYAGGNPMVSIRALPEGGPVGSYPTNLPMTFYQRYTDGTNGLLGAHEDRRQGLPSMWAARYLENGGSTQDFATKYAIWREGPRNASCTTAADNGSFGVTEIVRWDEHENPYVASVNQCYISPCTQPGQLGPQFGETGAYDTTDLEHFPPDIASTTDLGGWMYLNLGYDWTKLSHGNELKTDYRFASTESSWVIVQMTAEGRMGVDFDAAWLGNGCTENPGAWTVTGSTTTTCNSNGAADCGIGPAENETPYPKP